MSHILETQRDAASEIERLYRNYKKDSSTRKTVSYLEEKSTEIKNLWSDIEANHEKIEYDSRQPYFIDKTFEKCKQMFDDIMSDIAKRLEALNNSGAETSRPHHQTSVATNSSGQTTLPVLQLMHEELYAILGTIDIMESGASVGYINAQIDVLKEAWAEFRNTYFVERSKNQSHDISFASTQQDYISAMGKLKDFSENPINKQKSLKLPEVKLPQFNGSSGSWQNFITMFDEGVHNNPDLSDAVKVQYLKSSLQEGAMRLLSHVSPTPENYKLCYETLQRRYNNKKENFGKLFAPLVDMPKQNYESADQIRKMHDTAFECIMAVKNLGICVKNWDPFLVFILLRKLSRETITHYECNLDDNREFRSFDSFLKYLETRFLALDSAGQQNNGNNKNDKKSKPTKNEEQPVEKTITCSNCDGSHYITKCETFLAKTPSERLEIVKSKNLCSNCLRPHKRADCKSRYSCKTCKKTHNTLLHLNTASNVAQADLPINALCAIKGKKVLLATAIVSAEGRNGSTVALKVLIDQGSQNSFVSENAVQLLGAKKEKINATISGIGQQTQNASYAVSLNIKPRFSSEFALNVNAIVLTKLANLTDNIENDGTYRHLDGLVLADPAYLKTNEIDIILGASEFAKIIKPGLIKNNLDEPVAQQTELGWILSGIITNKGANNRNKIVSLITNIDMNE